MVYPPITQTFVACPKLGFLKIMTNQYKQKREITFGDFYQSHIILFTCLFLIALQNFHSNIFAEVHIKIWTLKCLSFSCEQTEATSAGSLKSRHSVLLKNCLRKWKHFVFGIK
ncbi:hypothetical protein EGR_04969 [Echinococcus granulosus]|uniref:Uncharacterized protein n=1 Tax=Echinococcus granulosus TaxID=6210 RepID=W6UGL1_ECHGR|nr:hypothetical protein EGR_04969 [Echinococcus granulosus]EUB60116.1 hypothetical protein EGR_04969 [Echinococcus granulosus]